MNSYKMPSTNCAWPAILSFINQVEDPIYSTPVDIQVYQEMYGPLLDTLDGLDEDSKVSFFFEISHVNQSILVFLSDKARMFFREEAEERNLIPKLIEVCEGETKAEKMKRNKSEQLLRDLKTKTQMRKIQSDTAIKKKPANKDFIIESAKKQLEKFNEQYAKLEQLTDEASLAKKVKLNEKISRIKFLIDKK